MKKETRETKNFRYERKFLTTELGSSEMLELVKSHPSIFSEIFYERQVNNIYFDTLGLASYHENQIGASEKIKIRIRWYGAMFGNIERPVLEVKMKNGMLVKKFSFDLKAFVFEKGFSHNLFLKKVAEKSKLPPWVIEMLRVAHPTLLNSYKRRYFLSADRNYRITLDRNLEFFRIKIQNNNFSEKIVDKHMNILELKYSHEHDDLGSNITKYLPFRLSASSKYIFGIDLLNL